MAFSQAARDKAALVRQQNAEKRAAEKLMSTGVGESKIFRDPDAPQEDSALLNCHINGKLIRDLGFTPLQLSALSWHHTDEGFAARNEGKSPLRVEVGNPLDKQRQRKKDDVLERGMETWEASDPMKEVIAQHGRPGFRNRFLSESTVKNKGTRGWQPVRGENGDPVKLGGMILAEMPEGKARARNEHYRSLAAERLKQNNQQYMESGGATAVADQ